MVSPLFRAEAHATCRTLQLRASLSAAAATFLAVGALIIILCSGLCLALPGIHALSQILLPVTLPATLVLLATLPLAVYAFLQTKKATTERTTLLEAIAEKLTSLPEPERKTFIEEELLPDYNTLYKQNILTWLLKKFEKPKAPAPDPHEGLRELLEARGKTLLGKKAKEKIGPPAS